MRSSNILRCWGGDRVPERCEGGGGTASCAGIAPKTDLEPRPQVPSGSWLSRVPKLASWAWSYRVAKTEAGRLAVPSLLQVWRGEGGPWLAPLGNPILLPGDPGGVPFPELHTQPVLSRCVPTVVCGDTKMTVCPFPTRSLLFQTQMCLASEVTGGLRHRLRWEIWPQRHGLSFQLCDLSRQGCVTLPSPSRTLPGARRPSQGFLRLGWGLRGCFSGSG